MSANNLPDLNSTWSSSVWNELRLLQHLEKKLPKYTPPLDMKNKTISVLMGIRQLLDVNEKEGIVTMSLAFSVEYQSDEAVWDPKDYGGLESIMIPTNTFWCPDLG